MKSSHFELLFLLISTHTSCHMTRGWTPVQTNQTAISSSESAGTWMIGKILFLIFSIKNALTVSFFKAVYIIKWRSRVHDAVMTPTQMISDFLFCITWTAEQLYFYFVLLCTHLYLMNGLGSDYLLSLLFQNSDDFFDAETSLTSGGARTRKNFEIKK